ncbi:MAG: PEP-CTERM sorting domain-containing protein [Akkermansia sp.]|nr:PEP-CTERM sorting domain-containing protein [Akkermansia sp.]
MKRSLFFTYFCLAASSAVAAVGDTIDPSGKLAYHIDGVKMSTTYGTTSWSYASVVQAESTRLYDSNKGGFWTGSYSDGTEYDSLMCWTHVATNSIQYWQDVYGVFYKDTGNMTATSSGSARELPNGYMSTENIEELGSKVHVNNARELNIAPVFYNSWKNTGGSFGEAADWFFKADSTTNPWDANGQWTYANPHPGKDYDASFSCGTPGGYYSEYFGNGNSDRDAFVTINAAAQTSAANATFAYNDREALKQALLAGLGFTRQDDGSYVQTQEGMMAALSLSGHVLNCYGFTTDANGTLNTVLIADGDNGTTRLQELLIKEVNGKLVLYRSSSAAYINTSTYIDGVSYINTPEVLQNMLKEYRSLDEAAVWNGKETNATWQTQVDVVDSQIANEKTGWDVLVNGDNIDTKHHGYYHGYALEGRKVLFDDHADADHRRITINGTVSTPHIEIAAAGYEFVKGTDGAITDGADLVIRSGAGLHSGVTLNLKNLSLEFGATLSMAEAADRITVFGELHVAKNPLSAFTMRSTIQPSACIDADLDLTSATNITLEGAVDMNGHTLMLGQNTVITLNLDALAGNDIPFFTNVGALEIDGVGKIENGTDLTEVLNITYAGNTLPGEDVFRLLYTENGTLTLQIPEPATTALSLLGLCGVAMRRRRK